MMGHDGKHGAAEATHVTRLLSEFVSGLRWEALPEHVVETTKLYIVDYYAACFAGMKVNPAFNHAVEKLLFDMGGREDADVLCSRKRLPAMHAAFLNAVYAHGADMDDGNRKAMGHVAAHVMSAVFALAQTLEASGRDVMVAIQAGYEVYNRVAAAVQPGLVHRGFHSTGTAGAIACAAACAKLMRLDAKGIYNAMSLAAIQASGLLIIAESGQACKPINPANAARTGILSATLAASGVESSRYPLESEKGWCHAMSDEADFTAVTQGLGETFTMEESYLKPYPSCRHTHCGIEAGIDIRRQLMAQQGAWDIRDIERAEVYIYPNAIRIAGQIRRPETPDDAKFSIHYSLAIALQKGRFRLEDLPLENLTEEVSDLIGRIVLMEDAAMENTRAGIRGARVVVKLRDGRSAEKQVLIPRGDAANPFTWADMRGKLAGCAQGMLSPEQQSRLIRWVSDMEEQKRFTTINGWMNED